MTPSRAEGSRSSASRKLPSLARSTALTLLPRLSHSLPLPSPLRFRGQGKRVSAEEKAGYHPDVHIRFQKKAWADDEVCEEVAEREIAEATADARAAGEESVCFYDNLSGQTTAEHKRLLKKIAKCSRHLLPTDSTSELMHIDDGIGARMKTLQGEETDEWCAQPGNLERWTTGPKEGGLTASQKRVLISQFAGRAWVRLCDTYNFEASAQRLGILMTIDGSGDELIQIQGLKEKYTFKDEDGGSAGEESEDEVDPADLADLTAEQEEQEGEGEEEEDEEEGEYGMENSDDEEDDTADQLWACGEAPEAPPEGYRYASCPPLETDDEKRALVGRRVLVAHITDPIGWHVGRVRFFGVGAKWLKVCATANFLLRYTKKETNGDMKEGQEEACELSKAKYGRDEWWLLLDPIEGASL